MCDDEKDKTQRGHVGDEDVRQRSHLLAVGENDVEKESVVEYATNEKHGADDYEGGRQCREIAVLGGDHCIHRVDASLI